MTTMLRPHIVILGAGFGGVYVAKKLAKRVRRGELDVTVVNRTNYFLFTPLLHEVATGSLSPESVAEPLREVFAGSRIRVIQGTVESVDAAARSVSVRGDEAERFSIKYDYLVIATGAQTNYYGIPGAGELAMPLKSLADAASVRNKIIDAFERAVLSSDPEERKHSLSFAVVGGGPTGVELAAELAEFADGIARRYYGGGHCRPDDPRHCEPEEARISLVNAARELLEQFEPSLRTAAQKRLEREGVEVLNGVAVTRVSPKGLETAGGRMVPASIIVWTAGVRAVLPEFEGDQPASEKGKLIVDEHFRLSGSDRIFALGDAAAYGGSKPLPMLAQVAEAEAKSVAKSLLAAVEGKSLPDFHYKSKGAMVSVGQWFAIGEIFSMALAGRLAWWIWRTVYLFKFASRKKRLRIAFEWSLQLFFPRDITKL